MMCRLQFGIKLHSSINYRLPTSRICQTEKVFIAGVIMTGKFIRSLEGGFRCLIGVLGGYLHWMTE
jgi:hypothetical protein